MIEAVILIYTGWKSELLGRYQYITITLTIQVFFILSKCICCLTFHVKLQLIYGLSKIDLDTQLPYFSFIFVPCEVIEANTRNQKQDQDCSINPLMIGSMAFFVCNFQQ